MMFKSSHRHALSSSHKLMRFCINLFQFGPYEQVSPRVAAGLIFYKLRLALLTSQILEIVTFTRNILIIYKLKLTNMFCSRAVHKYYYKVSTIYNSVFKPQQPSWPKPNPHKLADKSLNTSKTLPHPSRQHYISY